MAGVKVKFMGTQRAAFHKMLMEQHEQAAKEFVEKVKTEVTEPLLRKTLANNTQSGSNAFTNVSPISEVDIIKLPNKGVQVKYKITMLDTRTNKPHFIWHLLNRGRKTGKAKSNVAFRTTLKPRTTPSNLDAGAFGGYGGWKFVKKGQEIQGIHARGWYRHTTSEMRKVFKRNFYKNWDIQNLDYENEE